MQEEQAYFEGEEYPASQEENNGGYDWSTLWTARSVTALGEPPEGAVTFEEVLTAEYLLKDYPELGLRVMRPKMGWPGPSAYCEVFVRTEPRRVPVIFGIYKLNYHPSYGGLREEVAKKLIIQLSKLIERAKLENAQIIERNLDEVMINE